MRERSIEQDLPSATVTAQNKQGLQQILQP
jgi:hypothetical protein